MHWIKEVEMVDSVDDLTSSSSVRGIQGPDFEVLDAKIASALNRITHKSHFKRRVSLEEQTAQKEDRFLRERQIAYLIPRGWGPQGRSGTSGGGLARVPNLRVWKHLCDLGWHMQERKDEFNILPWYRPVGVAKTSSETNRIIHNTLFKKEVSLEEMKAQKEDRFLRGRQIAYLIYDYFRVTGIHDSVENYADLFTINLRNDDIQEFDSK